MIKLKFANKLGKDSAVVEFVDSLPQDIGDFALDLGEMVRVSGTSAKILVGLGQEAIDDTSNKKTPKIDKADLPKLAKAVFDAVKNFKSASVVIEHELLMPHFGALVRAIALAFYRYDKFKSKARVPALGTLTFVSKEALPALDLAILEGEILAKDVANAPANYMTPSQLAAEAEALANDYEVSVEVLGQKKMQKLGMGALLAVAQGSAEEPKLAIMHYQGGKKTDPTIALVGKGVTFDTGGISLKPGAQMDEMKFDMGGAAGVLGTIKAVLEAKLPLNIVAVLGCAENMPSANAYKPGDIVTAMNGTTIEVLNTDAEGRLVLADALCYVQKEYNPATVIDVATLTGACVVALGAVRSGLYCNDEDLLTALQTASEQSGDLAWHMPLDDAYQKQLTSNFADVPNIGSAGAGSITAACFLSRFINEGVAWAHLDIAGTAWRGGDAKGATGRPVPLLMHYLAGMCNIG